MSTSVVRLKLGDVPWTAVMLSKTFLSSVCVTAPPGFICRLVVGSVMVPGLTWTIGTSFRYLFAWM